MNGTQTKVRSRRLPSRVNATVHCHDAKSVLDNVQVTAEQPLLTFNGVGDRARLPPHPAAHNHAVMPCHATPRQSLSWTQNASNAILCDCSQLRCTVQVSAGPAGQISLFSSFPKRIERQTSSA